MSGAILDAAEILLLLVVLVLAFGTVPLFAQALAVALLSDPAEGRDVGGGLPRPRAVVLTPAHDEAAGIQEHARVVRSQLAPGDRHVVVADNCTDATAEIAVACGAEVVVRTDPSRPGKGYALAAGLERIARDPPDVVIVCDADCRLGEDAVAILAEAAGHHARPIQCLNLMTGGSMLSQFAWTIRNDLRPSGYARLGLPSPLLGTGMAVPWVLVRPEQFATGAVAEDLLIGLRYAALGVAPRFERRALVTSRFPDTEAGRRDQKRRWVHGHFAVMRQFGYRGLRDAVARRDLGLAALTLDVLTPPLSLLGAAHGVALASAALLALLSGALAPLLAAVAGASMLATALTIAWCRHGRGVITRVEIAALPRHVASVLLLGASFVRRPQSVWVRAERSSGEAAPSQREGTP